MKNLKYLITLLIITLVIPMTHSQDLHLTYADGNVSLPLNLTSSMVINSNTGDISVATTETAASIGTSLGLQPVGNSPGISFQVTLNGAATSATIDATITDDAVYCQKEGLWGTELIASNPPTIFVTAVTDVVTSNGTNYSLTCANSFGETINSTSVSGIVTVNNPVVTVTATPNSVAFDGSSTITWSVSNSPDTCILTGDWPANITKDGPYSFPVTNITSSKIYSALCDNAAPSNSGTITATISLQGETAWPSCQGAQAYILNGAEDRSILAVFESGIRVVKDYNGLYEDIQGFGAVFPWPGNFGDDLHLSLSKNKYIAAKFTTNSIGHDAKFVLTGTNFLEGPTPGAATYVISECPGDFDTPVNNQARCKIGGIGSLFWSTKTSPEGPPGFFCELQKNTTYYLNLVHSDNSENNNYVTSDCNNSYCGILASQAQVTF